ncbi:DUF5819 family protein [Bdellovibrio bacteriovorus]|uniref:DUF5819 family protein n=1 Tax=Bdellovibrio bacteriovorus TaxID=959 RepID=UPI0035A6E385
MNTPLLHILKLTLVSTLVAHLGIHALYLAPNNPATPQYMSFVDNYMGTFFTQNWHLFAPEPATSSLQLSYRCDSLQAWKFPLSDMLEAHKSLPVTATGKQTYVLQHLAREIFNSKILKKTDAAMDELHILQRYLQDQCGDQAAAEVRIQRVFTQDYSKRFTNTEVRTETFTFGIKQESFAWN